MKEFSKALEPEVEKTLYETVVSEIKSFWTGVGFPSSELFSYWTLIQIGILLAAILFSRWLKVYLNPIITERLRKIEGQRELLRFCVILQRRLFWFFMSVQLWIGYGVLRSITWPSHSYLIRVMASLATAWLIISIVSRLMKNRFISRTIGTIAWVVTALYITGLWPKARVILDSASIDIGDVKISLLGTLQSIFLLVVLIWLALIVSKVISNAIAKNDDISPSVKVLLQKILKFFLVSFAVLISLRAVGIDLTVLTVFSGALGIGIGLGLQRIVSNYISGIILLLDKSIKPGDVIEINTVSGSTYGWVQHLGARYTSVRTRDGTETLIPNESFIETPVTNWTFTNKSVRRKLPIGVSYETDVERAMELCIEAAKVTKRVLQVPTPVCLVKGFGDSSVDLELRFWINDPEGGVANVSSLVYLEVWRRFREANIEIPFPQQDLNIRSSIPIEFSQK